MKKLLATHNTIHSKSIVREGMQQKDMKNWGRILGATSLNRDRNRWSEKEDEGLG